MVVVLLFGLDVLVDPELLRVRLQAVFADPERVISWQRTRRLPQTQAQESRQGESLIAFACVYSFQIVL
jgi:hypothetical protein